MSEAKATLLLEHYLKQLKLPSVLREYEKMAAVCQQGRADYQTYLLRLTEVESADRERRAAERRVKAARFPVIKTLDTFDFKAQPSINQELVRELLEAEAGAQTAGRWQGLATQLVSLEAQRQTVAGRAAAAQVAGNKAFAVVRSQPLVKVSSDEAPPGPLAGEVCLRAARGEAESVQIALVPLRGDLAGVHTRLEPFVGSDRKPLDLDTELHRVEYVHLAAPSAGVPAERNWWPDVLLPADQPFTVKHVCQPLWLDLWTPRAARAGRYTGALVIEAAGQAERVPLTLEVLDFTLPLEHSLRVVAVAWLASLRPAPRLAPRSPITPAIPYPQAPG